MSRKKDEHFEIVRNILKEIQGLGDPFTIRTQWFTKRIRKVPDIIVEKGGTKIAIEVKDSPVTLADIRRARQLPFNEIIISAPVEALNDTSDSVVDYATYMNVKLCNVDELLNVLREIQ